jgi:hypothetical protein
MKGRANGLLLILGGLAIGLVLWVTPTVDASSHNSEAMARQDFDGLVRSVAERYQMHGNAVPMMWLANVCVRSVTHDGMKGIKVVEFEDAGTIAKTERGGAGLGDLVKERLGTRWSPMVRSHEAKGGDSFIYVQGDDDGKHMRMIVVDLDGTELDMVRMTLNPDQLAKWTKEHDDRDWHKSTQLASE